MSAAHSRGQVPLSLITDSIPEAVLRGYGTPVRAIGHELHLFACYVALDSTIWQESISLTGSTYAVAIRGMRLPTGTHAPGCKIAAWVSIQSLVTLLRPFRCFSDGPDNNIVVGR